MSFDSSSERGVRRRSARYSSVAIVLHWLIAALLFVNIWYGWQTDGQRGMALFKTLQVHKSIGVTVLILTLARLAWRLSHRPPTYDPQIRQWEHRLATLVHIGFYLVLLALPLTGWAIVSLSRTNIPTLLYDVVPWPHIGFLHDLPAAQKRALEDPVTESHHVLVKITYVLVALHIAGALKHAVLDRDGVAHRMIPLPFLRPKAS